MKFRVERDVLAEAVTWVARGLPARPPVPVLAGILLHAEDDGTLTLSAFDYEVSARITVAAEVSEPGTVLVLGRLLADISRNLPDRPIDVVTEGAKVQVTCGSSRFSLLMMPADDYPTLPSAPQPSGSIDGHLFTQAVAQVSVAADRGDTLPILTGVRVEVEGDTMTLLATDRYRLAMRELHWNPTATDASHVVLIPARTLSDISRSLGASGSVDVALGTAAGGDGLVGFEAGQRHTTTRLLDGEYPKVASIFPSSSETESVVRTSDLVEAVKRVALVAERNTPVRLRFSEGQVAIEAGTGDDAQASEAVEATLTGPEIEIAFNPTYLLDGLGAVGTPFSRISFTQASRPAVLTGQAEEDGEADTSYRYVLMPVRFAS
ncbi:MAG TPA: DNA polymerase III subunit beta [Ornithinibacter sp.]|uniref:Beta sliding clamp n=1 Tax=Ornithinibacter aureus TaxID=622664 RepID=A0ABP8JQF9_9MICO|nr:MULTISPECIES: DNA polymerase III subunit beta [Ornithinibacter]KAF0834471.1 DNA polymerase III beta subunit [Ornithinibacter aureus]HNV40836.1 DNA polymerase III subunit beta [Ornithinibacter sp.]HPV89268.1 DNA polymerase III subunit beta [Ornithinibacter sp.]HQV82819.1 DNA polymerase III subunit beta [Ornithinibacter sp.]HQW74794.1 DNA polymerase III subunit beta [Ornithinibacter sp.]